MTELDDTQILIWKGKEVLTLGDTMDAMGEIMAGDNPAQEAEQFMEAFRKTNEHADENIGYLCGYFSAETMPKALALFKTRHPIFGAGIAVTPEQAFEAGQTHEP